jgi:hypothetical protein
MLRTVPGTGEYSKLLAIVIWYFYYYKQVSCEYSGTSSFFTVLLVLGFELRLHTCQEHSCVSISLELLGH